MNFTSMRAGFSMLTAIVIIVLMASVAAMVMSVSGQLVKETTIQYQREQAMLLAQSYTEYAIMAVMANDRQLPAPANCLTTINTGDALNTGGNNPYNITVNIQYIGNTPPNVAGNAPAVLGACPALNLNPIRTTNSPLNVIIDVYVTYNDLDSVNILNLPFTYHKRTLQKI